MMTAASESTFIISDGQKEYHHLSTYNGMLLVFYPVKVQTEPDICSFYTMCFRDVRLGYTTERIASDSFKMYHLGRKKILLRLNIHCFP